MKQKTEDYIRTPPAQLKYFFDKNNNNKLSSTQKINCAQQSDRRVHSRHGTGAGRGAGGTGSVSSTPGACPEGAFPGSSPHVRLVFCFLACLLASSEPLPSEAAWPRARTPCRRLVSCNSKGMSWKEREYERGGCQEKTSVQWDIRDPPPRPSLPRPRHHLLCALRQISVQTRAGLCTRDGHQKPRSTPGLRVRRAVTRGLWPCKEALGIGHDLKCCNLCNSGRSSTATPQS